MNNNLIKVSRVFLASLLLISSLGFTSNGGYDSGQTETRCITEAVSVSLNFAATQKNQNESRQLTQHNLAISLSSFFSDQVDVIADKYTADIKFKTIYKTFLISHFATST